MASSGGADALGGQSGLGVRLSGLLAALLTDMAFFGGLVWRPLADSGGLGIPLADSGVLGGPGLTTWLAGFSRPSGFQVPCLR